MAKVAERYAAQILEVRPGDRLHRLMSILFDTYIDDLTDERIAQLETLAESWRWMNADGQKL